MNRAILKKKARECMGGGIFQTNWLTALAVCFLYGAILGAVSPTFIGTILLLGPMTYGLNAFFLKQARLGGKYSINDFFSGFECFGDTLLIGLMTSILTFLWSMLFIIPGIVKSYAYSMAYFVKVDHPDYDWKQCIEESKRLTNGHKGELFVLDLSFIGWFFVGALCLGVGTLWVVPYTQATKAQFYMELTKTDIVVENEE